MILCKTYRDGISQTMEKIIVVMADFLRTSISSMQCSLISADSKLLTWIHNNGFALMNRGRRWKTQAMRVQQHKDVVAECMWVAITANIRRSSMARRFLRNQCGAMHFPWCPRAYLIFLIYKGQRYLLILHARAL